MIAFRCTNAAVLVALALVAGGCGTPREKTAPCKRPANVTSYAVAEGKCGPMTALNTDRAAALALAWVIPQHALLGLPTVPRFLAAVTLAFFPVFTANLVFTQRFKDTASSTIAFGANLYALFSLMSKNVILCPSGSTSASASASCIWRCCWSFCSPVWVSAGESARRPICGTP
jgi:hypothetical protein